MREYRRCPFCGAYLDDEERCDCVELDEEDRKAASDAADYILGLDKEEAK